MCNKFQLSVVTHHKNLLYLKTCQRPELCTLQAKSFFATFILLLAKHVGKYIQRPHGSPFLTPFRPHFGDLQYSKDYVAISVFFPRDGMGDLVIPPIRLQL